MRFNEFYQKMVETKAKNMTTKYSSEVGLLAYFCGVPDPSQTPFDPANPGQSFPPGSLEDEKGVLAEIAKVLPKNYDPKLFHRFWKVGEAKAPIIAQHLQTLGYDLPQQFNWQGAGNINDEGAADVLFPSGFPVQGISVKAEGGITLANLSPKTIGLNIDSEETSDVFQHFAGTEFLALKKLIWQYVIQEAKANPGVKMGWHEKTPEKYCIIYDPNGVKSAAPVKKVKAKKEPVAEPQQSSPELDAIKKNAGIQSPNQTNLQGTDFQSQRTPSVKDIAMANEDVQQPAGTFTVIYDNTKQQVFTEQELLATAASNAVWQRVFGDWYQAHWNDPRIKKTAVALFIAVSTIFESKIETAFKEKENLRSAVRMGDKSYFYVNPKDLYFVPSVTDIDDLHVESVTWGIPEGTSQYVIAKVGHPGSTKFCTITVYIRYANGTFSSSPTARIQNIKDTENISWIKL